MLMKTTTTDTAEIREESGIDSELIDSSLLSGASRVACEACNGFLESRGNVDWIVLFRALADLTRVQAEAGDPQPRFTMSALLTKCAEINPQKKPYWLNEDDTGRKKFITAWEKLEEAFPRIEVNLRQRAEKMSVPGRVLPFSDYDPLDKRTRLYGFRLLGISLPERIPANGPDMDAGTTTSLVRSTTSIEYLEEMEIYPIPWFRHPLKINVQGWRSLSLTSLPVLFFIAITFGSWVLLQYWLSTLPVREVFQATLVVALVLAEMAWFIWPVFRLVEDRIIIAPGILQLAHTLQHVLLIKKEGSTKFIRMVRFTGTCPLCDGQVEIHKGRGVFRGRLVGKCEKSPVEHLYSFDHVLRRGNLLR